MARQEQPKEDLLRQATGLADRAELVVEGFPEKIVVGFRSGTAASVYFGDEPAYHWNAAGELRRAYVEGRLIKADHGRLIRLEKRRAAGQVQLIHHEINEPQRSQFLADVDKRLKLLQAALRQGQFQMVGQASSTGNEVLPMIRHWLVNLPHPLRVADTPQVGG